MFTQPFGNISTQMVKPLTKLRGNPQGKEDTHGNAVVARRVLRAGVSDRCDVGSEGASDSPGAWAYDNRYLRFWISARRARIRGIVLFRIRIIPQEP